MASSQNIDNKDGDKMKWMYTPAALVDRDEYLLGRSVDKTFSLLEAAEKTGDFNYADEVEKDLTPISIFTAPKNTGPVDIIKKIKEDPLYKIQKKEEENLKQLLKNPVRMKQLREITERQERQRRISESSSTAKSKKRKKHEKKRRRSKSGSSSSSDQDAKLALKNMKSLGDIDKLISEKLKSLKESGNTSSSESSDHASDKKYSRKHSDHSQKHNKKHQTRDRESTSSHHEPHNHTRDTEHHRSRRKRTRSRSSSRGRDRDTRVREDRTKKFEHAPSSGSSSYRTFRPHQPVASKRKSLDEDELEKRRQEMMSNAKWRDEQRTKNVSKYREEEKKEEESRNTGHDPDFIRKQLIEAANTGSVEKRIKSNAYNIQKSAGSMNKNFARR